MKHYRNLNGCVSKMHRVIYDAYDKGYAQGRKDYERARANWIEVPQKNYSAFRCDNCKSLTIAKYLFCPHCGFYMGDGDYGTEKK